MLHDCPLESINVNWVSGIITIQLDRYENHERLIQATGFRKFDLSRLEEWGPSQCINKVIGPSKETGGLQRLTINMQSGDVIEIMAESFLLPAK